MKVLSRRAIASFLLISLLGGLSACKKKKPVLPPPQAQVPSIILPLPEPLPPPTATPEPGRPVPETIPVETAPPKKKRTHIAKKPQQPPAPTTQPQVQRPSEDTQLTSTNSPQEALNQQINTTQLLDAAENNLKSLNRSLSSDEQSAVQHVRSYIQQSRAALDEKDFERAYNLAFKARLLSDELVKR